MLVVVEERFRKSTSLSRNMMFSDVTGPVMYILEYSYNYYKIHGCSEDILLNFNFVLFYKVF